MWGGGSEIRQTGDLSASFFFAPSISVMGKKTLFSL
jgi:hypothetical protein